MKTKEVRGITIISLVVTIVVLLILAGVSVSLVIGNNNLFDKAKSTQKVQTIAGIKEFRHGARHGIRAGTGLQRDRQPLPQRKAPDRHHQSEP